MNRRFDYRVLGRKKAGVMNKTEAAYSQELELKKQSGEILFWKFEPMSLKLAPNTHYKPDFLVIEKDGTASFHEVKGFMTDDANAKIKIAAELFPFSFVLVRKKGNTWTIQIV